MDRTCDLIEIELAGLITMEERQRYADDLRATFAKHGCASGHAVIINVLASTVHTQEVAQRMREDTATLPKARAIALVTTSQITRMQVRRILPQPYARIVATMEDARAWVLDGIEPPREIRTAASA